MRHALTALMILAGTAGAQARYNPAGLGHDVASQRLAQQDAANHAMAAQARADLRGARFGYGRPQRQAR